LQVLPGTVVTVDRASEAVAVLPLVRAAKLPAVTCRAAA
jgi:hypothetical protein